MCSLAYVPVENVRHAFRVLKDDAPEELGIAEYVEYFEQTYVIGIRGYTACAVWSLRGMNSGYGIPAAWP